MLRTSCVTHPKRRGPEDGHPPPPGPGARESLTTLGPEVAETTFELGWSTAYYVSLRIMQATAEWFIGLCLRARKACNMLNSRLGAGANVRVGQVRHTID